MLDRKAAARWYLLGVGLSLLAVVFGIVSLGNPRLGYPGAFVCTMFGVFAVTGPSWPRRRLRLVAVNVGVGVSQLAILFAAVNGAA